MPTAVSNSTHNIIILVFVMVLRDLGIHWDFFVRKNGPPHGQFTIIFHSCVYDKYARMLHSSQLYVFA